PRLSPAPKPVTQIKRLVPASSIAVTSTWAAFEKSRVTTRVLELLDQRSTNSCSAKANRRRHDTGAGRRLRIGWEEIAIVEDIAMIRVCPLLRYGLFVLAFAPLSASASTARVYVTNSAGDSIHVLDPTTNKVVQVIKGIEASQIYL